MEVKLPDPCPPPPREVSALLREADRRIERFQEERRSVTFVPSDHELVWRALSGLAAARLAPGDLFCEWGSGFGVATCLAAMAGFEAYGIEIDEELAGEARRLASDFGLPATFIRDSFIPSGSEGDLDAMGPVAWLATQAGEVAEEWGLSPADFDVIFAYPWPDEEDVLGALFERHGAVGALFLTYQGREGMRLRRKTRRRGNAAT